MDELVKKVLMHNSRLKNKVCCIEEMSELTKVLTKSLRSSEKFSRKHLIEELAHVLLMCNVIAADYGVNEDMIREVQKDAIKRMEEDK